MKLLLIACIWIMFGGERVSSFAAMQSNAYAGGSDQMLPYLSQQQHPERAIRQRYLSKYTANRYAGNGDGDDDDGHRNDYTYYAYLHRAFNKYNNNNNKLTNNVAMPIAAASASAPATTTSDMLNKHNMLNLMMMSMMHKRGCVPRNGVCDHRPNDCCFNTSCRCNLWGSNCRCQRIGLFQKWG